MKWKEVISLIVIVLVALFCVQVYIKRGVQGRLKLNDGEEQEILKWAQSENETKTNFVGIDYEKSMKNAFEVE